MGEVSVLEGGASARIDPLFRMAVVNGINAVVATKIRKGVDVNARDDQGATVLMLAARKGHSAICRMLLDAGADSSICDYDGRNAAEYAALNKHADAYLVIIEKCSRPNGLRPEVVAVDVAHGPIGETLPVPLDQSPPGRLIDRESGIDGDDLAPDVSSFWEIDPEPVRPQQDVDALRNAASGNLDISLGRPKTDGEDWSRTKIDLPVRTGASSLGADDGLDAKLRRPLGGILLQGIRFGLVRPARIAAAASLHPEASMLARSIESTLESLGAEVHDAAPDLWPPVGDATAEERLMVRQALKSIALDIARGPDEIGPLRVELERWGRLTREDESIYSRQIQEGFQDALSLAARSEDILSRIINACEDVLAGCVQSSTVFELDDESPEPDEDEDAVSLREKTSGEIDPPELPESWKLLQTRSQFLRDASAAMRLSRPSGCDPLLARRTARLLAQLEFATPFLRMLSTLAPSNEREARIIEEYGLALKRVDYARERMVASNMKLVIWQAKKYPTATLSLADLVQEGAIGLMKAASKFDHKRGFRFSTYAIWWIRQSITRAIADGDRTIRLPVHVHEHYRRLQRQLRNGGEFVSLDSAGIAKDHDITPRLVENILGVFFDVECVGGLEELTPLMPPAQDGDPAREVDARELRREIASMLSELDPRHVDIVNRRFGLADGNDQTLEEIGQVYGITRERIRQIEAKVLKFLAHPSRSHRLEVFLK